MKIKRIEIRNFYSIKDVKLNFEKYKGVTLVEGVNKDTGGSNGAGKSALFEAVVWGLFGKTIRKSTEAALINNIANKGCSVKLFLDDGVVIIRSKKPTSLEFRKGEKSLTRASALETQKIVESYLKIDYKTFMSSMILGQHNNVDFLSATPEDKRTIVKNFLNLDELFGVREKIRSYKSSYNSEAKSKVSVIKEHLGELKRLETKVSDIEKSKQGCDFPENIKSFDPSEVVRLEKEYDAACREIFEAKTAITKLDEASHELILKINKGVYEDNEECPSCNQDVKVSQTEEDIEKYDYQVHQFSRLREAKSDEIDTLIKKRDSIDVPISHKKLSEYGKFNDLCVRQDTFREIIETLKVKIQKREKEKVNSQTDYEVMKFWEKAFSEQGLVRFVVRNILDHLNNTCNRFLSLVSGAKLSIEFDERLNEKITSCGMEVQHVSLSGGERRKVNVSILLALQSLLSLTKENKPNLLFFDEVAENLDEDGVQGLYILMQELKKTKDLFIITHNNHFKSVLDFDNKITMIKSRGISKLKE